MSDVVEFIKKKYEGNEQVSEPLIALYDEFSSLGIKDGIFDQDITDGEPYHFYSRIWEMVLAKHLTNLGYKISSENVGPDFLIEYQDKRIWIEAICPSPVGLSQEWLDPSALGDKPQVFSVPHEAMLLRWTSSLKEKNDKLTGTSTKEGYLQKGIVKEDDAYIIAISSCQLGLGLLTYEGISQYPFAVEAVFPIGPYEVVIERETGETKEVRHEYRPAIMKPASGAEVKTDNFLNPNFAGVSSIIGSNAGINAACGDDWPLAHVHNPNAHNPIPKGILGDADEFFAINMGEFLKLEQFS